MTFTPPPVFTTRPTLRGSFGMTASTHYLATAAGQSVLERGGNAFDAAVATAFVLHVVEPHLNGPGGDLSGTFLVAGDDRPRILAGQGPAPEGATIAHYRGEGLEMVPGAGALAAAVPGAVPAWLLLLAEHGTFELADVLGYAIDLAENGHLVLPQVANAIAAASDLFAEHWPTSAELWLVDGAAPAAHSSIQNPTLADTLRRLVEAGDAASDREGRIEAARVAWSEGFVAEAIDRFVREAHRHSTGGDHAGVLRASDLAAFRAGIEDAATGTFRGATIAKTGPWGQGPVLLQALAILEHQGDDLLDPSTARGIHTIAEALKLALADRDAWYGDGGDVPLGDLLDPAYAAERAALIGERASAEFRPGSPGGREPWRPPLRTEDELRASGHAGPIGEPTLATEKKAAKRADDATGSDLESGSDRETDHLEGRSGPDGALRGDTCHLDVVDRWGNVVAVTPSGGWLQSSPTIPELGFCLGTRLQMMWLDEASPSALLPGRRPRTTLTPTIVTEASGRVIGIGTPGGDQQDQWQLLALLRMLVGGYTAQEAIDAPAFHTTSLVASFWPREWTPAGLVVEARVGSDVIDELRSLGHEVVVVGDWALGRLSAVTWDAASGALTSAANPRGMQGYAAGR